MESLHPDMRAALKAAHPGLTDSEIDQHEELLAQRLRLDSETQEADIRAVGRRREQLVQQYMPKFQQVAQMFNQRRAGDGESLRPS